MKSTVCCPAVACDVRLSAVTPAVSIVWDATQRWFELNTQVTLPHQRTDVFGFFSDAFQLERITPPWLNFRVLTPAPIDLHAGSLIDYRLKLHGIPIRWRTEISTWDPPYAFTDRQLRGPYRLWEHLHTFEEVADGTLVRDRVRYRVPGGRLINWLLVQHDVQRIFEYRGVQLLQIFAAGEATAMASGRFGSSPLPQHIETAS